MFSVSCCLLLMLHAASHLSKIYSFSYIPVSQKAEELPGGAGVKNLPTNAGDMGLIPGSGRTPGGGSGNPFQYFCLKNSMDRGAWQATVRRVTKSRTQLSD